MSRLSSGPNCGSEVWFYLKTRRSNRFIPVQLHIRSFRRTEPVKAVVPDLTGRTGRSGPVLITRAPVVMMMLRMSPIGWSTGQVKAQYSSTVVRRLMMRRRKRAMI